MRARRPVRVVSGCEELTRNPRSPAHLCSSRGTSPRMRANTSSYGPACVHARHRVVAVRNPAAAAAAVRALPDGRGPAAAPGRRVTSRGDQRVERRSMSVTPRPAAGSMCCALAVPVLARRGSARTMVTTPRGRAAVLDEVRTSRRFGVPRRPSASSPRVGRAGRASSSTRSGLVRPRRRARACPSAQCAAIARGG